MKKEQAKIGVGCEIRQTPMRNYRKNYSHPGGVSPSFKNACKIADALGVSLDELRGDKKCNH